MAKTTDLVIQTLKGGMNDQDPPSAIKDDQCVLAMNVEFFSAPLGERRAGSEAIALTDSGLSDEDEIVHLAAHYPLNSNVQENELWAVGATPSSSLTISRRDSSGVWHQETHPATPSTSPDYIYKIRSQSLHGKLFIGMKSNKDRMLLWDGTQLRFAGMAVPTGSLSVSDSGSSGTFADARTYRVRAIQKSGSTILRRSEPTDEVTFTPSGTKDGAVVDITGITFPGEGETHWELEASNGDGNFYIIATEPLATTSYTDTTNPSTEYGGNVLSEPIGEYDILPSFKFVIADQDRLILANQYEDAEKGSRIAWTPVWTAPGFGNDERLPSDTDNYLDLDWMDGGEITGISAPVSGSFYAFKWNRVYKIQRTGILSNAYESFLLSTTRGAVPGSIVSGNDEYGRACVYFLDPAVGPARIGSGGLQYIRNIRGTWRSVNSAAAKIVCHGVYYADKQQIIWWVSTNTEDSPDLVIRLQVSEIQADGDGTSRGWSLADGAYATAYSSAIIYEADEDPDTGVISVTARPYIGLSMPTKILRTDVGTDDDGVAYRARIVTKPYIVAGLLNRWGGMNAALLAAPLENDSIMQISLIRDFGKESAEVTTDFLPESTETTVIKRFDQLAMSNATTIQVEFADPPL
jgi:hypothetical protein